jgi:hypothetical protein
MNRISGKVLVKESGLGIPNLLVVVFDLDPRTQPEEILRASSSNVSGHVGAFPADRLGSVATDEAGSFELRYEDDEFRVRNPQERRPDLFVTVMAPEEAGAHLNSRVLFASSAVRQNAARTEQYLIRLTTEQLRSAGVPLPTSHTPEIEQADQFVDRVTTADLRLETIDASFRVLDSQRVERVRRDAMAFSTVLKPAFNAVLSRVPEKLLDPSKFVSQDESVAVKTAAIIRRGIEQVVNSDNPKVRAPVTGFVALTDEQEHAIAGRLGPAGALAADTLDEVLGGGKGRTRKITFVVRDNPVVAFCREISQDEAHCASALGILGGSVSSPNADESRPGDSGDHPGTGVEEVTGEDIPKFVARLMDTMTSPEERVLTALEPRADRAKVEENIRTLSFPPSPADTTAFYDFHNLQIAFEHVWQEAIDEGILDLAEDAYQDIVELGGDPIHHDALVGTDPFRALLREGRLVLTSRRVVRDHRGGTMERDQGGEVTVRDHRGETVVRDHRGETVRVPAHPGKPRPGCPTVPHHPADRLPEILAELEQRLREDYAFTIYAANRKERSINFGILSTYRQVWEPLAYQAGKLAKTITLAPKETQKYSKKTVVRRKRAEKEVENHLRTRKEEARQTSRAEQEIIRKATTKTNFSLTSKDSLEVPLNGGASLGGERTATFDREASRSSDDIKKGFHEAVFAAAQEYKDEHNIEINTEESEEVEVVESGEITNPNDEIAVTFLFYELQRRYRVKERIHRLNPVILVAQEVPRPNEIDEDWLLTYDWILRRVLLDDSFVPALNYLSQNIVGEQVALGEMRLNIDQQRRIVEELRRELGAVRERLATYRGLVERSLVQTATKKKGGGGWLPGIPDPGDIGEIVEEGIESVGEAIDKVGEFLFGGDAETGQSRQDALKEAMQRAADEERDILFRLEREVTALNALTETYAKAYADYLNHKTQVARLRVHVKQNILFYMQAIWSHEPPDQRFFRLHQVKVPVLESATKTYFFRSFTPVVTALANVAHRGLLLHGQPRRRLFPFEVVTEINPDFDFTTLAQVADLDTLLGFKGNYMIFPLKQSNALTDYMMEPYVVAGLDELIDPDDVGNWTLEEFAEYVCCLKKRLSGADFNTIKDQLAKQYERLLTNPRRSNDVITVPTNSLFIEALPARHSLMEEFKARHRAVDVKKVQAEVRQLELDNVRAAARILKGELEDPDIEKKIVIEGNPNGTIVPAEP